MEWLLPLAAMSEYTDLHMLRPFVLTFGLFMLIDYSKAPIVLGSLLKLLVCMGLIGMLFYRNEWLGFSWLDSYLMETAQDLAALMQFSPEEMSPHNRTLMFLLGWALLISVMYATVVERQQALWLIAATIVYLVGLQLWADIDTSWGVLRTSVAGMLLMAVNQLSRIEGEFRLWQRFGVWPVGRWSAAAAVIMAVAIGAGLWLSRDEARLTKPLAWNPLSESWTRLFPDSSGTEAVLPSSELASWTGYSSDDSRLGGPIRPDDGIAFTARTEQPTYWRGESRSTYTGRGWMSGGDSGAYASADHTLEVLVGEAGDEAGKEAAGVTESVAKSRQLQHLTIQQEVLLENESLSKQLFVGGPIVRVEALVTRKGKQLDTDLIAVDPLTGRTGVSTSEPIGYYRLAVEVPADGRPSLAQAASSRPLTESERASMSGDLQLPAALPERVRELSRAVTANTNNDYSKALAVEAFLRSKYTYSLDKPTFPSGDQDFVDHFLFEQKVGYCNHFSTSMVVMLRTLGIPARWVKGFSPGQLSTDDPSPTDTLIAYTVLNRDAHSWVEVYFPDQGWVAFEPTPGFTRLTELNQDQIFSSDTHDAITVSAAAAQSLEGGDGSSADVNSNSWSSQMITKLKDTSEHITTGAQQFVYWTKASTSAAWTNMRSQPVWFWGIALLLLALPAIWKINELYRKSLRSGNRTTPSARSLKSFDTIWVKLNRKLGKRLPEQTVREYVHAAVSRLPDEDQRQALHQFAGLYEAARYSKGAILVPSGTTRKKHLAQLWSRIARSKST
jgi:transglutaminase-like putative cysteine protease